MNTVMHSVINIEKKRHCLFLVLTAGILFISLTGCENFQDSGSKTGTDLLSEKGEGRAPNPEVINGVATYHQSIRIGQTFYVPDSWNKIVIKKNVIITGNFVAQEGRTKSLAIVGEDWNTSVIKGTGKILVYKDNALNRRLLSAVSMLGTGDLYIENLKSLNPDKFHFRTHGLLIVRHCKIIQDKNGPGHCDGVHAGKKSNSEVHDSFISTGDDATYASEFRLIKNTTIEINRNGAPFQIGYGNNDVDGWVCDIVNCTVISNSNQYSKGVVSWTSNGLTKKNTITLNFKNFTFKHNPGSTPANMYQLGGNHGGVPQSCEIHVYCGGTMCDGDYLTYLYKSNSRTIVRLLDCCKIITSGGVKTVCSDDDDDDDDDNDDNNNDNNDDVVQLFPKTKYKGKKAVFNLGKFDKTAIIAAGMKNNDAESIKILPGYKVTLFDGNNFNGYKETITINKKNLGKKLKNKVSSMIVEKE